MSATAIARVPDDIAQLRNSIGDALALVARIGTTEDASEAYDRVKLAKEWAKIRKAGRALHNDLLRLEIHMLRKVTQLDALGIIPAVHRAAAKFFADKTDGQIETLIATYGDGGNPTRIMRRALGDDEQGRTREHFASGEYLDDQTRYVSDEARAEAVREKSGDTKAALAALVEDYYEDTEGFSTFELAEQLSESVGLDQRSKSWGTRQGLLEVCRKAVREAPTVAIPGTNAPRFITCIDRRSHLEVRELLGESWIRVPFHAASLDQLDDMVALRKQQADEAAEVAKSLRELRNKLASTKRPTEQSRSIAGLTPDVTLGELAARLALGGPDGLARPA